MIWVLSGLAAWLWIIIRNDMVDGGGDAIMAALQTIVFMIAGPFAWGIVLYSEISGRIK